jgi:hypothetical protein
MTLAEALIHAVLREPQDHPVSQAADAMRNGRAATVKDVNPLILVDAIRLWGIVGLFSVVDDAYQVWKETPSGAVHFEAALVSIMAGQHLEAEARCRRAVHAPEPEPMAWNSLALLLVQRASRDGTLAVLDDAVVAIEAGLAAMPGDALTMQTASAIYMLKGDRQRAAAVGGAPVPIAELVLFLERMPHHADLAREAIELLKLRPPHPAVETLKSLLTKRSNALNAVSAQAAIILSGVRPPTMAEPRDGIGFTTIFVVAALLVSMLGVMRAVIYGHTNGSDIAIMVLGVVAAAGAVGARLALRQRA